VERDTFHALVGENGAGKSTLGRIFAGLERPSSGELRVDGTPVRLRGPGAALNRGVTMVVQERTVVPSLSVLDNVLLNREVGPGVFSNRKRSLVRYEEICEQAGFWLDPQLKVGTLRPAEQLRVEILRALARDVELLVLDEVTAALAPDEAQAFFGLLRQLRGRGRTIVYVTHFLSEVTEFADTVTILREGRVVRTSAASQETPASLVTGMLGRPLESVYPEKIPAPTADVEPALRVRGLIRKNVINSVDLEIRPGEILGLAGLVGSGRSEIARAIFGADRRDGGVIELDGIVLRHRTPQQAIRHGIALVPESRQRDGLVLRRSVGENLTLAHLNLAGKSGFINKAREMRLVKELIHRFDIRTASPSLPIGALSGGNQQKALFAKWLVGRPKVFIADEPTRGVDIGAKHAIYVLLNELASQGAAILLISSELEEVLNLAHRVLVVRNGTIVSEFEANMSRREAVLRAAFGTVEEDITAHELEETR
jgi:simple sugar transport system ATP-binding protein/ribose transport system ATP-binding protein